MKKVTHNYEEYSKTKTGKAIDKAIADLVKNNDIIEQTSRTIIVGYICKILVEKVKQSL